MSAKGWAVLAAALWLLVVGLILGVTWWWALFGMSEGICMAWLLTAFAASIPAFVVTLNYSDAQDASNR